MALGKIVTVQRVMVNNAKASTTVSKPVIAVVVNDQLVADERDVNSGVNSSYA
jgi:hypothetical protein